MTTPVAPRRLLTGRRTELADRLLDSVPTVIASTGYDGLTVRSVARAAGVSPASAYNYFASKDHLVAEVFWRRVEQLATPDLDGLGSVSARVEAAVRPLVLLVADEPELAAGVTTALLAHDPDVGAIRARLGAAFAGRLAAAVGDELPRETVTALALMLTGGMLTAGLAILDYRDLPGLLASFADLVGGTATKEER